MCILSRIIKDSFLYSASDFLLRIVSFFIPILIAREFGSELFGQYSYALAFTVLFVIFADFNVGGMIIREIAINRTKANLYISNALFIKTVLSFLAIIFVVLSTLLIHKSFSINLFIYLLTINAIIKSFIGFFYSILSAYEKIKYVIYLRIIENMLLVLFFGVLLYFKQTLLIIVIGFILSSILTCLIVIAFIKNKYADFSLKRNVDVLKYLFKKNLPFGLSVVFSVAYFNIDTLMVSYFKGYELTGIYSVAFVFFTSSTILLSPLSSVLLPVLSRKLVEYKDNFQNQYNAINKTLKYSLILVAIGILISLFYIIFADIIIDILYGFEFARSSISLKILAIIIPFWFIYLIIGTIFSALGRQYIYTFSLFIGVILNIFLNLILIPVYSEVGAAIASLITMIFLSSFITIKFYLMVLSKENNKLVLF